MSSRTTLIEARSPAQRWQSCDRDFCGGGKSCRSGSAKVLRHTDARSLLRLFALALVASSTVDAGGPNALPSSGQEHGGSGACCVKLPDGPPFFACFEVEVAECDALGGTFLGVLTTCKAAPGIDACDCNDNHVLDRDDIESGSTSKQYDNTVMLSIPDGGNEPGVLCHTFQVPDVGIISDVNVGVKISHSRISDLRVAIERVSGEPNAVLFDQHCFSLDDIDAVFDDESEISWCPLVGGLVVNPLGYDGTPLSIFDGREEFGQWTLCVSDHLEGDIGTLDSWALHLAFFLEPTSRDCNENDIPDECEDPDPGINGACCLGGPCMLDTEAKCAAAGGLYLGDCTNCGPPNPCQCQAAQTITCNSAVTFDNSKIENPPSPCPSCQFFGEGDCEVTQVDGTVWFKFLATDTEAHISTCNTTDPVADNSLLAVFDDCVAEPENEIACQENAGSSCAANNFLCVEGLTPGNEYWIQISSFSPSDRGEYLLELFCPCVGACCDDGSGRCTENEFAADCSDADQRFAVADFCENFDPDCVRGACCDDAIAQCVDDVALIDCPPGHRFEADTLCDDLDPGCGAGACCFADGSCEDTTIVECEVLAGEFHFDTDCGRIICNLFNSCIWDNGRPGVDTGFATQWDPIYAFFAEVADDFILQGPPGNDCRIDTIVWYSRHFNHNSACAPGGVPGVCDDAPSDWWNVQVTVYEDTGEGPGGEPLFGGHTGLIKVELTVPPPTLRSRRCIGATEEVATRCSATTSATAREECRAMW